MQLKMLINIRRTLTLCLVTLIHISMEVLAACKVRNTLFYSDKLFTSSNEHSKCAVDETLYFYVLFFSY